MTVSDYALAVVGGLACIVWIGWSLLKAIAPGFASREMTEAEEGSQRGGCFSAVLGLVGLIYCVGVIVTGSWEWVS